MPKTSPHLDTIARAVDAAGPHGVTVKELAVLLAGVVGEWAINKQAGKLSQTGRITRQWEYYDAGLKGPIGRWRYFPA